MINKGFKKRVELISARIDTDWRFKDPSTHILKFVIEKTSKITITAVQGRKGMQYTTYELHIIVLYKYIFVHLIFE